MNNYPFLSFFWPINRHEITKIIPMMIILFLFGFNQSVLWSMKDSLLITVAGAEVIPFIKVWAILPGAVLLTWIFTGLSKRFSQEKVFYLLTSSFLFFYVFFAFVIYPNRDQLLFFESSAYLKSILPVGCKGLISMYCYWPYTCFYVLCELWTTVVISVLFWGFANQVTRLSEAGRFYSVLSLGYNLAIVLAGVASLLIVGNDSFSSLFVLSEDAWEQTMKIIILLVVGNGLLAMGIYRWMHKNVLKDNVIQAVISSPNKKDKLSLIECLRVVGRSKTLICIAGIVVGYGLTVNLVEVVWKDQLRNLYPAILDYNNYINYVQIIQGLIGIFMSLGIAAMIKKLGWKVTALITPLLVAISCFIFFGVLFFEESLKTLLLAFIGMSPLTLIVFFGSIQNCVSKGCKASLYDATKEMAYIPLDSDTKLMGKAAIDGIGTRLGKSGGSIILQGILILVSSLSASVPYIGVIVLLVLFVWLILIIRLGSLSCFAKKDCLSML